MITFDKLGGYGRLGNQLFQYAILKSVSLKTGYDIVLNPSIFTNKWHGQKCLLNNFTLKSLILDKPTIKHNFTEPINNLIISAKKYDERVYNVKPNTNFIGFFQNPKYYEDIKEEIREEIKLKDEFNDWAKEFLKKYNNTTVSLHVRRGDVSDGTNKGCGWANDFSNESYQKKYYTKALETIPKDSTILLFTGGGRDNNNNKDYLWCKKNFTDDRIIFMDNLNEMQTFSIMTKTDINIIGFKSTFGWWGAFLNEHENVYAPYNFNPTIKDIKPDMVYPGYFKLI